MESCKPSVVREKNNCRIQATSDFGVVKLDIQQTSALDQGVYTCKAVNSMGEAVVFTKVILCDKLMLDVGTLGQRCD